MFSQYFPHDWTMELFPVLFNVKHNVTRTHSYLDLPLCVALFVFRHGIAETPNGGTRWRRSRVRVRSPRRNLVVALPAPASVHLKSCFFQGIDENGHVAFIHFPLVTFEATVEEGCSTGDRGPQGWPQHVLVSCTWGELGRGRSILPRLKR